MVSGRNHIVFGLPALAAVVLLSGCDAVFGVKQDKTTEAVFEAGRSEPRLINEVEYVPLFPFFTTGGDGAALQHPRDLYVGFDELIYVVDERGLHILDVSGRPEAFVAIPGGATSVTQDRRLRLYVAARRDTLLAGRTWNLPVVLRFAELESGSPAVDQIIWHPFDDDSRIFNRPDPIATDEEVEFTGVGVLFDNRIYISRKGPVNDRTSVILPHNIVLEFTDDGRPAGAIVSLHPTQPSLRSALYPTDILTYVHPPQRSFYEQSAHFILAQSSSLEEPTHGVPAASAIRYSVLSIRAVLTPDGLAYQSDPQKLQVSADPERGDGFLYEEFKFTYPSDLALAADGSNYLFVVDAARDSLYAFTSAGVEGVAPPPGAQSIRPVIVSFGGSGDGSMEFDGPLGVAYFERIVYVADTGNNRISRFRLNTDFE